MTVFFVVLVAFPASGAAPYSEAPMLAERVARGELPPVEQRLPDEPFVVGPGVLIAAEDLDWEPGQYGGTLRGAHLQPDNSPDLSQGNFEGVLDMAGFDTTTIVGNIVRDFAVNDDNTVFTFYLREGLRWSDGVPVTTEDVRFTYEDVYMNSEIYPAVPVDFRGGGAADGEPMSVEIVDEFTFVVTFDRPYGAFLTKLAHRGRQGASAFFRPSHYLKQFHIDYATPEELEPYLAEQELDIDEWYNLFQVKDVNHRLSPSNAAIGSPSLYPWVRVESPPGIIRMERNPYFYKVDVTGQQLPYIDYLESHEVVDHQALTMRLITGEIDYLREAAGLPYIPLYQEHAEQAGIVARPLRRVLAPTNVFLNYTYSNEAWQGVAMDVRFRQALSLAIDRQEILDTVLYGMASMPSYVSEDLQQYDPDRASALLDDLGLDARDEQGYRLGPDGETFSMYFDVHSAIPEIVPVTELVVEFLSDIGLNASMRQVSTSVFSQMAGANEIQLSVGWLHPGSWPNVLDDYAPGGWGWGVEWNRWHNSGGATGTEPPDWAKEAYRLREKNDGVYPGSAENQVVADSLRQWVMEYLPFIILVEEMRHPLVTSVRLGNVADRGFSIPAYQPMEQMFFRSE